MWEITAKIDHLEDLQATLAATYGESSEAFFAPTWQDLADPQRMKDISTATTRIVKAITNKERIMVFGDFDADGVTSTAILVDALRRLGALVSYRIPDRVSDSHGLKDYLITEIVETKSNLLITADCGINDQLPVAQAAAAGIDVIITDHHQVKPSRFPDKAMAVINPHQADCEYPESYLSGAGVVFKLTQALAAHYFSEIEAQKFCEKYLDIVALGMVADCMPLKGEVRHLVKMGLTQFRQTEWPGFRELMTALKIDPRNVTEETIGFYLAPVINAASRLGNVQHAVQLFLGDAAGHTDRVNYLQQLNNDRKDWSKKAGTAAQRQVDKTKPYQLITTEEWPIGVLGLVGSRLVESCQQPIIVMRKEGEHYKASCRAPAWANIEKCLRQASDLFDQMGGHPEAAGFSMPIKNLSKLKAHLDTYYDALEKPATALLPAWEISPVLLDLRTADLLAQFAPFGIGAPAPNFVVSNISITDVSWVGVDKNHARITFTAENKTHKAMWFHAETEKDRLTAMTKGNLLVSIGQQIWRDVPQLQLFVRGAMTL